jgi:hypothetical protein
VIVVAKQISTIEHSVIRDLLGHFECCHRAHLKIGALESRHFRARLNKVDAGWVSTFTPILAVSTSVLKEPSDLARKSEGGAAVEKRIVTSAACPVPDKRKATTMARLARRGNLCANFMDPSLFDRSSGWRCGKCCYERIDRAGRQRHQRWSGFFNSTTLLALDSLASRRV